MAWWDGLFGGGGQALGAGSGPHPRQMAALAGSSGGGFWGGKPLPPDSPWVTGGLGAGLGLLRAAQPGGGGLGAGLGAGLGGLAQGLLTSAMMKQSGREDGLLSGMTPGERDAPPVAGNPPAPTPGASGNGAPPTALLPDEPTQGRSPPPQRPAPIAQSEMPPPPVISGGISGAAPPPVSPPMPDNKISGGISGAPPVPMSRPQTPQLPMPGMGAPPPSPVGGMLLNQHMQNPALGGPRMGPPPMAGGGVGMPPIASFTGGTSPPMPGMQQASMGMGSMNPNDIRNMPPHIRDQFIRNFAANRGGMF